MDTISSTKRSLNMSRIRSKNTEPELRVRSMLHKMGYRFRLHRKEIPGVPDIVLKKHHTVVFVNGCFWHRHANCKYAYTPKSRVDFWETKFRTNVKHDEDVLRQLNELGWEVITLWECETEPPVELETRLIRGLKESLEEIRV